MSPLMGYNLPMQDAQYTLGQLLIHCQTSQA